MEDEEKRYFRVGSALDTLLTDNEQFHHEFKIVTGVRPYGLLGKFVDNLPFNLTKESPEDLYQEAYEKSGYKAKLPAIIKKFWAHKGAVEYYESLCCEDDERSVLSKDEYDLIIKMKNNILYNPYTVEYFMCDDPDVEIRHQLDIYFEYKGEECKALLDGLKIDHKNKTIQPFDLKTTGKSVYEFDMWYLKYGYYRQAAFYVEAVKWMIKEHDLMVKMCGGTELGDYKILPFQFIVVESRLSSTIPAIIFESNEKDLECGLKGGMVGDRRYPGIDELLEEYVWHRDNDEWDMKKELYENKGKLKLNVFR